jgi:L-asparaginase
MDKSSILIIYTGGTIGMVKDEVSGTLRPVDLESLYENIPVLEKFDCSLEFISFDPLLDSSNINPSHWVQLVDIIEENYEKFDGFVVLHGSDTMAFTASALSFMLENLNKPVILTGSQLPLGMIRTDGRENFVTAIEIASAKEEETPVVPEVAVCFENQLLRGNRIVKYNAEHFEAFRSENYPVLAEVGVDINYNYAAILRPNFKKLKVHRNLDTNIAILRLFPGITEGFVRSVFEIKGLKGVILETYGSGNALADHWFLNILREYIRKGLVVYNVTQCMAGSVDMFRYETGIKLKDAGVIGGYDITLESALAKVMYLLGSGYDPERVKELLTIPLRGELTIRRST